MAGIRKPKTALKFDKPASWWGALWRDALPAGNGLIGASVYGRVADETVMLTHGNLNWQGNIGVLPDVSDKLKDVRKLMLDDKARDAEGVLSSALITKNYHPQVSVPLPVCDFKVKVPVDKSVREYARIINMENGEITVTYRDGSAKYDRSMFVSRVNDCIVYEISRSGQKNIDAEFSFQLHDRNNNRTPTAVSKVPDGVRTKYENYFMYFTARSDNGTEFGAVARVSYFGGSQEVRENSIYIKGASDILVIIKLFAESQHEKEWKNLKTSLAANKLTYDKMLKEHTQAHSKLFGSAEIDLDAEDRELSVEALLDKVNGEIPPALLEKLWYFGRYLFISSAREDGHLCSPYGLWCGDYKAAGAQSTADGTLGLLYSLCLSGNLSQYLNGVFSYYENVISDLKKNAQRLYACRGIFVPSVTAGSTGLLGSIEPEAVHYVAGSAVIANMFYRYYQFTGDKKFLKDRAMPFMKEAVMFYEDFFKLGLDGKYISCPSYSPSNSPSNSPNLRIAMNSALDFSAVKELLGNLIEGSGVASLYKDETAKWRDMLGKLPEATPNKDGAAREYLSLQYADNYSHRMASHLYPVYPGNEVFESESEQGKSYLSAAKKRLSEASSDMTSWGYCYLASVFTRLGDAQSAFDCLYSVVKHCLMDNLVTAENDWRGSGVTNDYFWAPYRIQGNIAFTDALTSMYASSDGKVIKLVPALPDFAGSFSISGIAVQGGVEVSLSFDKKKQSLSVSLKSKRASEVDLQFPPAVKRLGKSPQLKYENGFIRGVSLPANKAVSIEMKL